MSRREHPEARRLQLLEAGARLWASRPFDAISSSEMVDATGVSIGLVYHYFGSKRGFYEATVKAVATRLLKRTQLDVELELFEALRAALEGFLDQLVLHPGLYRATLRGGVGFDPQVHSIAEDVRWTIVERIRQHRPPARPERRLLYGWLGFVEFVALDWAEHQDVDRDEIVALALQTLRRILS